eukprot:CAMPEP_0174891186 /NCGR_PEP_ID=MMETSP0167-20121228/6268_1 /TAXON_ID=38298 /ORGANISM="Rhodella maculata, Strain CCMP736" /LENGTH=49 /DNA_ID=CAMNT_0016129239 /DNA_START=601 /DNA_END=750 /DNA_ORIENTATION=+
MAGFSGIGGQEGMLAAAQGRGAQLWGGGLVWISGTWESQGVLRGCEGGR